MKKLVSLLIIAAMVISLCSCGSEDIMLSGGVKTIEILLTDTDVLQLSVPVELQILKQDNNHYYEFSSGVGIYRMTSTLTTAKLDEATGLYLSSTSVIRNFDNCCVVINCSGVLQEFFKSTLSTASVVKKDTNTYKELAMTSLPSFETMTDMELVNDLYMPPNCEDVLYDVYSSKLYTQGADWLQSTIVDAKLTDLKPKLVTLALLNSGADTLTGWYESDDIFYCYTERCIVGAKKLAFNSWYVYQGSSSMKNYILTGVTKVHGKTSTNLK